MTREKLCGASWHAPIIQVVLIALICFLCARAEATVWGGNKSVLDLTSTNALEHCQWTPAERYNITPEGLGWEGPTRDGIDYNFAFGEILTQPIALGYFWRPAKSARIRVELTPGPLELSSGGKKFWSPPGRVFVRHTPDLVHWSSWQPLGNESRTNRVFEGELAIPSRDQRAYESLRVKYAERSDTPWSSDEEAAVKSILRDDPDFFIQNLPFIGYIQVLFEGEFIASRRFREMKVDLSYSIGGLHQPPPEKGLEKQMWSIPWRFKASQTK